MLKKGNFLITSFQKAGQNAQLEQCFVKTKIRNEKKLQSKAVNDAKAIPHLFVIFKCENADICEHRNVSKSFTSIAKMHYN